MKVVLSSYSNAKSNRKLNPQRHMISTLPKVQLSQWSIAFTKVPAYHNLQVDKNYTYQPTLSFKISIQGAVKKHTHDMIPNCLLLHLEAGRNFRNIYCEY